MTQENPCNVDDLMCQIGVKAHLEGIKLLLGDEKFRTQYPEFQGLEQTVSERIKTQKTTIRETFEKCGIPVPEGLEESNPLISEEESGEVTD